MNKKPNCECKVCKKEIVRKPSQIKNNVYCSKRCLWICRGRIDERNCDNCGKFYKPSKKSSHYCCRICSNIGRRGISYSKKSHGNNSQKRLAILKNTFDFKNCMVQGCEYNKTYDIHRLIEGKNGGTYEIGNMFAICPNHHAEIHRGLIDIEKIDDCTLKTTKKIPQLSIIKIPQTKLTKLKKQKIINPIKKLRIKKQEPYKICPTCQIEFSSKYKHCSMKCSKKRKVKNRPELNELNRLVAENGYCATGRIFGVSGNAIRKWIKMK